ncbi:MAG: class I SAM-dependent rRNA methyltransferase, partial [Prolixibacteraceae bacterium]|nr:class I SAM-dependent rRNA methyltransferase [Prolixibacteraceae bacterium]
MSKNYSKIVLKSGKDQSVKRFHPWVFSGAIKKTYGALEEGDLVEVFSNHDEFLGIGHYQVGTIAIRIVSFEQVEPDYEFWKNKIEKAWNYRQKLGFTADPETNVFRLIHAEGDGMPGLIVDFYNGTAVMQMHSVGMFLIREELVKALKDVLG